MPKKPVTPEEVKEFIQDKLVYINRTSGDIEYRDADGDNYEQGFKKDVYEAINKAILIERKSKPVVY